MPLVTRKDFITPTVSIMLDGEKYELRITFATLKSFTTEAGIDIKSQNDWSKVSALNIAGFVRDSLSWYKKFSTDDILGMLDPNKLFEVVAKLMEAFNMSFTGGEKQPSFLKVTDLTQQERVLLKMKALPSNSSEMHIVPA